jgi:glycosyltransferase involved in cell wall biosynthesis
VSAPLRVAFVSPLPPAPSGIADYAGELLPHLAGRLEVEVFPPPDLPPPAPGAVAGLRVRPWEDLAAPDAGLPLYHLGNDRLYHGAVYRALLARPGVLVLHEYVLHHMLREMTLARGDAEGWVEELRYAYGRTGESLGRRSVATGVPLSPWGYPLFERAVDASRAVIVHNETTARRVRASRPGAWLEVVPHHVALGAAAGVDPEAARHAARQRLGLPAEALLVGTYGYQTPPKRLDVLLRAFARLRAVAPEARLLVVGAVDRRVELDGLLAAGLGEGVQVVGRVDDLDEFLAWMQAVDLAVNLRWPTAGETSGTVMRLLGLGKPLVVTDAGAFAEIPAGCAARVPPDEREEGVLVEYLRALAQDPGLRRGLGDAARRHMAEHHSLPGSGAAYAALLERVAAAGTLPSAPVPPLAPWREGDLYTEVLAELAAEAVDLGVDETDGEVLACLAEAVVDLGLDLAAGGPQAGVGVRRR